MNREKYERKGPSLDPIRPVFTCTNPPHEHYLGREIINVILKRFFVKFLEWYWLTLKPNSNGEINFHYYGLKWQNYEKQQWRLFEMDFSFPSISFTKSMHKFYRRTWPHEKRKKKKKIKIEFLTVFKRNLFLKTLSRFFHRFWILFLKFSKGFYLYSLNQI